MWPMAEVELSSAHRLTLNIATTLRRLWKAQHTMTNSRTTQRAPALGRARSKLDNSCGLSFQQERRATTQQFATRIALSHGPRNTIANRARRRSLGAEGLVDNGPPHLSLCTSKALYIATPITNARTRQFLYKCSSRYSVE